MEHRKNSEYGENIYCSKSTNPNYQITGKQPVDNWYGEIKDFKFGKEPSDLRSGSYTKSCKFHMFLFLEFLNILNHTS